MDKDLKKITPLEGIKKGSDRLFVTDGASPFPRPHKEHFNTRWGWLLSDGGSKRVIQFQWSSQYHSRWDRWSSPTSLVIWLSSCRDSAFFLWWSKDIILRNDCEIQSWVGLSNFSLFFGAAFTFHASANHAAALLSNASKRWQMYVICAPQILVLLRDILWSWRNKERKSGLRTSYALR